MVSFRTPNPVFRFLAPLGVTVSPPTQEHEWKQQYFQEAYYTLSNVLEIWYPIQMKYHSDEISILVVALAIVWGSRLPMRLSVWSEQFFSCCISNSWWLAVMILILIAACPLQSSCEIHWPKSTKQRSCCRSGEASEACRSSSVFEQVFFWGRIF